MIRKRLKSLMKMNMGFTNVVLTFFIALLVLTSNTNAAETWATKLGYPENKRVIIFEAKEAGMCYETNVAVENLFKKKHIQAASVMAPCPWFKDFAKWNSNNKGHDVGLSLTFVNDLKNYPWRTVSSRKDVPTLTNGDGEMPSSISQFMFNASVEDVTKEIQAQIQRARSAGIKPTFFSTHMGEIFARPDLVEIYLNTSRKHWIPVIMVELTPEHINRFRKMGVPLDKKMIELITTYPLPKVDDLQFAPMADSYEKKSEAFIKMIKGLSPGLTHIRIPVAVESGALKRIKKTWQQDVWNAKLLADPKVHEALKDENIELTTWSEIMNRFEGKSEIKTEDKKESKPDTQEKTAPIKEDQE